VTIVGSGGVGKTTVALAIAHQFHEAFDGAVLFVDLSMLRDPSLVATGVASTPGLSVQSEDVSSGLIAYLSRGGAGRGRKPSARFAMGMAMLVDMREVRQKSNFMRYLKPIRQAAHTPCFRFS
jgi:anion-transporting  ArsA/GET3 family ATPase